MTNDELRMLFDAGLLIWWQDDIIDDIDGIDDMMTLKTGWHWRQDDIEDRMTGLHDDIEDNLWT